MDGILAWFFDDEQEGLNKNSMLKNETLGKGLSTRIR